MIGWLSAWSALAGQEADHDAELVDDCVEGGQDILRRDMLVRLVVARVVPHADARELLLAVLTVLEEEGDARLGGPVRPVLRATGAGEGRCEKAFGRANAGGGVSISAAPTRA